MARLHAYADLGREESEREDQLEPAALTDEGRFRLLVNALADHAIAMLDVGGRVVTWNAGARRITGYADGEIVGQHFARLFTDEDRALGEPERVLRTATESGHFASEGWRLRKDGSRFWAHTVIDPIRGDDGKLMGFGMVTRDLSERHETQQALLESEQQFRLLVQSVGDYAIYMLDAEGHITNWNLGAERIKGYSPDEVIGRHFSMFYTDEDRAAGLPAYALATAAREGRFEREGWRVRKDGTRFWANVVVDPIRDSSGKLIGFAKVTRDVTERINNQRALEQAREAFFQSQKLEAIGQLTGGIAHDFNNLLMVISGSLDLLSKRLPEDPRSRQLLSNAMLGAERGASLTRRMLAFARRADLSRSPTDLNQLVEGMLELLRRSLGPEVAIETRFPPDLPKVSVDPNQIELAILNLAVNARDAMTTAGTIIIGARAEEIAAGHATALPPGSYACLFVTDSGTGMDEETLAHATEPFFTTKGVGKGTGLGLSMVHGLAEQLGGRLTIKSRLGHGTTVEIWLPAAEETAVSAPEPRPAAPAPAPATDRRLKILAVDDDGLVLMNTTGMLEDMGHELIEAASGRKALELVHRHPDIDLVITDQAMPQMTGLQLAEEVRALRPHLPIIIATGYAELPPGSNHFPKLDKPFFERQLTNAIAAAMQAQPAAQ
jgi:PAS domain S-box-containing protein